MALSVSDYASAVASGEPTPGGGSVIATVAALAAGLAEMVCRLTLGRPQDPEIASALIDAQRNAAALRTRLLELAEEDERAYGAYRRATALPRANDEERAARRDALQMALEGSAAVPLVVASACVDLLDVLATVAEYGTTHARADVLTSVRLGDAALTSALDMVRANTVLMRNSEVAGRLDREVDTLRLRGERAASLAVRTLDRVAP
jgi:glutamate formiminotransferase/formiminotetrahydrofolate cyclodeaminase